MLAIDPPAKSLNEALASKGSSTHTLSGDTPLPPCFSKSMVSDIRASRNNRKHHCPLMVIL